MRISNIDSRQQKQIAIIGLGLTFVSVLIAGLVYIENKKHARIKEETLRLDREIKTLDLALKKQELAGK